MLWSIAAQAEEQTSDAKFQSTYVWQNKAGFRSPYAGANSLTAVPELSYTWTMTAYLGWRPWANGEFYLNPETIQGRPLSNLAGLGGLSNGELQKGAATQIRLYRARMFYRHTVGLNSAPPAGSTGAPSGSNRREDIESDQNQLAGQVDARRFVMTIGNFSVADIFGTSDVTGDLRTQFLNWSSITYGHFDYAADARGYSWGAAGEWIWDDWALRGGRFLMVRTSNGQAFDYRIGKRYGDQFEVEHRHRLGGQPGTVKALVYRNVATAASYLDALNAAPPGGTPALDNVRRPQAKVGWGVSLEQSLSSDLRVLARGGSNNGKVENYAFAEIDHSVYLAASLKGSRWGRAQDNVGVAYAINGLSANHRNYLAAGGMGFLLGDGALNYSRERVFETYYNWEPAKGFGVTLDWQHIANPGFNRDRGPVNIGSVRLHVEF